jgi:SPP1 gp7 family putative phage head morphogenesis protein
MARRNIARFNLKRGSVLRLRARLTKTIAAFLRRQTAPIAAQLADMRRALGKALSADEQDAVDRLLDGLDFSGWAVLAGEVEPIFEAIAKDGAYAALAQIHFDVEATAGAEGVVDAFALDYARARSGELVGMRYDALGRLVANPSARWAITDSTRTFLRSSVESAIAEGWSNDKLADEIRVGAAFSAERAMMVARTETNMASNAGALADYKTSGVVDKKEWLTAEDDLVDEEDCAPNSEQGPIDLDESFQSGDDAPPAHPNCRCVLAPVINEEGTE